MPPVQAIIAKELRSYFVSPIVYVVGGVFLLTFGFIAYLYIVFTGAQAIQLMKMQGGTAQINLNDLVFRNLFASMRFVFIQVLSDHNDLHTQAGHISVGWLVVEDLLTVVALVLLPALFGPYARDGSLWTALGLTALKVGALVAFTALVGARVIPKVLDYVADTRSRELFTLTVLVIALGIAVGSSLVFSVSMALGAFLAGMVVGRSEYSLRAASEALPMRDAFAVLFFVSVGMLLDPAALMKSPWLVLGALGVVLVGKPMVALIFVWVMRYPFSGPANILLV